MKYKINGKEIELIESDRDIYVSQLLFENTILSKINELVQALGEPVECKNCTRAGHIITIDTNYNSCVECGRKLYQEVPKKWDRRELKDGDRYWYVCGIGAVNYKPYINSEMDKWNIESGNCFKSKEDVIAYKQKLIEENK